MAKDFLSGDGNIKTDKTEIEILEFNSSRVKLETINSGFDNERKLFNISGRVKKGIPTKIGTISFKAGQKRRFLSIPGLVDGENNNLNTNFLSLKYVTRVKNSAGEIISYLYDVMYTANENLLNGTLDFEILDPNGLKLSTSTDFPGLTNIEVGSPIIKPTGEIRKIRIIGDAGITVLLLVNKIYDDVDSNGNRIHRGEESILPLTATTVTKDGSFVNPNSRLSGGATGRDINGNKFLVSKVVIPSSGEFSFYQNFKRETSETRYAIHVDRLGYDSIKGIIVRDDSPWQIDIDGWDNYATHIFTQFMNPVLTLKTVTSWSNATLDKGTGTFVTFDNSNPCIETYTGRYDKINSEILTSQVKKSFLVKYIFKASSGAFALRSGSDGAGGTLGAPLYSNVSGSESDWTNSIHADNAADGFVGNGGTIIDITAISVVISTTSSSNDTLTLSYYVDIEKWGTKSLTMELNVDNIATLS